MSFWCARKPPSPLQGEPHIKEGLKHENDPSRKPEARKVVALFGFQVAMFFAQILPYLSSTRKRRGSARARCILSNAESTHTGHPPGGPRERKMVAPRKTVKYRAGAARLPSI